LFIAVGGTFFAPLQSSAGGRADHAAEKQSNQQDHAIGDAGRHDEVEIHIVKKFRCHSLADHPCDILERA
jgi:hypothetical protein